MHSMRNYLYIFLILAVSFSCYSDHLPNYKQLEVVTQNSEFKIKLYSCVKYLGVIIDKHFNKSKQTIRSLLYRFKQYKQFLVFSE